MPLARGAYAVCRCGRRGIAGPRFPRPNVSVAKHRLLLRHWSGRAAPPRAVRRESILADAGFGQGCRRDLHAAGGKRVRWLADEKRRKNETSTPRSVSSDITAVTPDIVAARRVSLSSLLGYFLLTLAVRRGSMLFIPWMQVTDALLGHLGFMPGERVYFSVDYAKRHIVIRQAFD